MSYVYFALGHHNGPVVWLMLTRVICVSIFFRLLTVVRAAVAPVSTSEVNSEKYENEHIINTWLHQNWQSTNHARDSYGVLYHVLYDFVITNLPCSWYDNSWIRNELNRDIRSTWKEKHNERETQSPHDVRTKGLILVWSWSWFIKIFFRVCDIRSLGYNWKIITNSVTYAKI